MWPRQRFSENSKKKKKKKKERKKGKKSNKGCKLLFLKLNDMLEDIVGSNSLVFTTDGPWVLFHIIFCQTLHLFSSCKTVQTLDMSQTSSLFSRCSSPWSFCRKWHSKCEASLSRKTSNIPVVDKMAPQKGQCPNP